MELLKGDCLDLLDKVEDRSIDLILCDLPYGVTANKWDEVIDLNNLWKHYKRVIKNNRAVILFASQPFTTTLVTSNKKWFRYEWVWEKDNGTGFLNANRMPLKKHESILVFYEHLPTYNPQFTKGKPYTCKQGSLGSNYCQKEHKGHTTVNDGKRYPTSVLKYKRDKSKVHPTQKPVSLLEYLIRTYTNEGDVVLDTCMGSGSAGVASVNTSRDFIGIEKDEEYFKVAEERINTTLENDIFAEE